MLRTNNRGVARAFANHEAAVNSNGQFFSPDGVTLYSYGAHWPIAIWHNGHMVFHREKYGVTTSKHTQLARCAHYGHTDFVATRRDLLALQGKAFL